MMISGRVSTRGVPRMRTLPSILSDSADGGRQHVGPRAASPAPGQCRNQAVPVQTHADPGAGPCATSETRAAPAPTPGQTERKSFHSDQ